VAQNRYSAVLGWQANRGYRPELWRLKRLFRFKPSLRENGLYKVMNRGESVYDSPSVYHKRTLHRSQCQHGCNRNGARNNQTYP
jgi:hypothetical protein